MQNSNFNGGKKLHTDNQIYKKSTINFHRLERQQKNIVKQCFFVSPKVDPFLGTLLRNFGEVDTLICGFDFAQTDFRTPPQFWNPQIPTRYFSVFFHGVENPFSRFRVLCILQFVKNTEKRSKYLKTVQNVIFGWIWLDFG